jgi:bifunctional non-homologous end joining protein LigD
LVAYKPQLATLVKEPPVGDGWLHEFKFDGFRIGCHIRDGRVTLITRNGKDWTQAFSPVAEAALKLKARDALIDGEVAVEMPDGRTSFQALQNAGAGSGGTLRYFVFDLLRLDGRPLASLPLEERKAILLKLVGRKKTARIRFSEHFEGHGKEFFREACRAGLEGIISKRRDLPYREGRSTDWVKTKCERRQEFVVGGFTEPQGMRAGIGALLIGYYHRGKLVPAGKVGTGFSHKFAVDLRKRLDTLEQKSCPFDPPPSRAISRGAHWVKPALVCEVRFTEWTSDGNIRHPAFQGLRADKNPLEVVREKPRP